MINIIWTFIGLNLIGLVVFIFTFFALSEGRSVENIEKSWTAFLFGTMVLLILLAVIPLWLSQSTFSLIFSGFFAVLPLVIVLAFLLPRQLSKLKKGKTFAKTYYKNKTQRSIATAIQNNDTVLLKELIKGQDLNIRGTRVWDQDGLSYLQFAVRFVGVSNDAIDIPSGDGLNTAVIRLLIANGADTKPALAEACGKLPADEIALFLDAGANPNCPGVVNLNPLLFEVMGNGKRNNDIAILLIQRGADVNAIKDTRWTPLMYAAKNAGTYDAWRDTWRLVLYLLKEAHADYNFADRDGNNLAKIIKHIRSEVVAKEMLMSPDFYAVVEWLGKYKVDATPRKIPGF